MYKVTRNDDRELFALEARITEIDQKLLFALNMESIDELSVLDQHFINELTPSMELFGAIRKNFFIVYKAVSKFLKAVVDFIMRLWEKVGGAVYQRKKLYEKAMAKLEEAKKLKEKEKQAKAMSKSVAVSQSKSPLESVISGITPLSGSASHSDHSIPNIIDAITSYDKATDGVITSMLLSLDSIQHAFIGSTDVLMRIKTMLGKMDMFTKNKPPPEVAALDYSLRAIYKIHYDNVWRTHLDVEHAMSSAHMSVEVVPTSRHQSNNIDEIIKQRYVVSSASPNKQASFKGFTIDGEGKYGDYRSSIKIVIGEHMGIHSYVSQKLHNDKTNTPVHINFGGVGDPATANTILSVAKAMDRMNEKNIGDYLTVKNRLKGFLKRAKDVQTMSEELVKESDKGVSFIQQHFDDTPGAKHRGPLFWAVSNVVRLDREVTVLLSDVIKTMTQVIKYRARFISMEI